MARERTAHAKDTPAAGLPAWQQFVLDYGWRAYTHELAHVVGQSTEAVLAVRSSRACSRLARPLRFVELFTRWNGRAPAEADWPIPVKAGRGEYGWQLPEITLLAKLTGQMGVAQIAQVLTDRLRALTGDARATRSRNSVQVQINKLGMQAGDVLGGITAAAAGREIGSYAIVHQAITQGDLASRRVGRLLVIPHESWAAWKQRRSAPPAGYVQLSTLRQALGIRSDKLPEFARMGYVPSAVLCQPYGNGVKNGSRGSWWISPEVASQLLADRRAGRPMPWHGKPLMDNLKATWRLWQQRKHPAKCETCAEIWGEQGAPDTFEDYVRRYPPLAHGAKRHLTMPWSPGLTLQEVARKAGCSLSKVRLAVANGMLQTSTHQRRQYASRTEATRWIARHCPSGESSRSWLALATAARMYLFTERDLHAMIASGQLLSKLGSAGAMRGITYVPRQQVALAREKIGFTEKEAAARLGITVPRLQRLLEGVAWRAAPLIPLVTVQAVRKRLESREGWDVKEAAAELGTTIEWVQQRIDDGTVRISRAKWDQRRRYLSAPMMQRLRQALRTPHEAATSVDGLGLSPAAALAGVSTGTIIKWAEQGLVQRSHSPAGWRYEDASLRTQARRYWENVRYKRARAPAWITNERRGANR